MTVAEYMAILDARSVWMGPAVERDLDPAFTGGEVKVYEVLLLVELPNGTYQGVKQGFYVYDEGGPSEAVYPVNRENQNDPPSVLRAQLATYIENNMIDANRPKVTIDVVNEEYEFAIVTAYEVDAGELAILEFMVGTDDLNIGNYTNLLTPANWNFTVEDVRMTSVLPRVKSPHGSLPLSQPTYHPAR